MCFRIASDLGMCDSNCITSRLHRAIWATKVFRLFLGEFARERPFETCGRPSSIDKSSVGGPSVRAISKAGGGFLFFPSKFPPTLRTLPDKKKSRKYNLDSFFLKTTN